MPTSIDPTDCQGLIVSAFAHLPCAAYRLLRVRDRGLSRAWLRASLDFVTAAARKDDHRSLNVACTYSGLAELGVPDDALAMFPVAFQEGMASPRRSHVLGDSGPAAPGNWSWGGPSQRVDVVLLVYAKDE